MRTLALMLCLSPLFAADYDVLVRNARGSVPILP
jgi:hypothetical protein